MEIIKENRLEKIKVGQTIWIVLKKDGELNLQDFTYHSEGKNISCNKFGILELLIVNKENTKSPYIVCTSDSNPDTTFKLSSKDKFFTSFTLAAAEATKQELEAVNENEPSQEDLEKLENGLKKLSENLTSIFGDLFDDANIEELLKKVKSKW